MFGFLKAAPARRRSVLTLFLSSVFFAFSGVQAVVAERAFVTPVSFDLIMAQNITQMLAQEKTVANYGSVAQIDNQGAVWRPASLAWPKIGSAANRTKRGLSTVLAHNVLDPDLKLKFASARTGLEDIASLRLKGFRIDRMDHLPPVAGSEEWACMAEALYFEARGEKMSGQIAVAEVILNRVKSRRFPNSVCAVVSQGSSRRNACQFSFKCDGQPERFSERKAYERVGKVAQMMLDGRKHDLTGGATHYHTTAVKPGWSRRLTRTTQIGEHLFYRHPDQSASN